MHYYGQARRYHDSGHRHRRVGSYRWRLGSSCRHPHAGNGRHMLVMAGDIHRVIMQLGLEGICKVCDFENGSSCEKVIWYLGDQLIVPNAVWTNCWLVKLWFKYMADFRLGFLTYSVPERLVSLVTLLSDDQRTEWFIDWVFERSADRLIYRRRQNFFLLLVLTFT